MRARNRSRPIIALVAAYVVALQALLLPLSVAAASPFVGSLCVADGAAEGTGAPVHRQNECPCTAGCGMQCGAHQASAPPPPFVIASSNVYAGIARPAPALAPVFKPADRRPQIPRAPPYA